MTPCENDEPNGAVRWCQKGAGHWSVLAIGTRHASQDMLLVPQGSVGRMSGGLTGADGPLGTPSGTDSTTCLTSRHACLRCGKVCRQRYLPPPRVLSSMIWTEDSVGLIKVGQAINKTKTLTIDTIANQVFFADTARGIPEKSNLYQNRFGTGSRTRSGNSPKDLIDYRSSDLTM